MKHLNHPGYWWGYSAKNSKHISDFLLPRDGFCHFPKFLPRGCMLKCLFFTQVWCSLVIWCYENKVKQLNWKLSSVHSKVRLVYIGRIATPCIHHVVTKYEADIERCYRHYLGYFGGIFVQWKVETRYYLSMLHTQKMCSLWLNYNQLSQQRQENCVSLCHPITMLTVLIFYSLFEPRISASPLLWRRMPAVYTAQGHRATVWNVAPWMQT